MGIYDCFLYNGEKELFDIAIGELSELEAVHVAVCGRKTFTGKDNLVAFPIRPIRLICDTIFDMPESANPWELERYQRNHLFKILIGLSDDDIIIIRDADEIPSAESIKKYNPEMGIAALVQNKYGYWLNCQEGYQSWARAKIMTYGMLKNSTPDAIRNAGHDTLIPNGGWHWSWLGKAETLQRKLESFSHTECNTPELNNKKVLENKIETGQSLWGDDFWKFVPIDETFPKYVQDNQHGSLKHLIKQI